MEPKRNLGGRPRKEKERSQFLEMWAAGISYNAIAKALGVTRACIFQWRAYYNLPRRKHGKGSPETPTPEVQ